MIRLLTCAFVMLALSVSHAAPARPLYEPPEPPKPAPLVDLRGTTWRGVTFTTYKIELTFSPDGRLIYHQDPSSPGSWKLTGKLVYFEINNKASEHRGTIAGNVMEGISTNDLQRLKSPFKLTRVRP